MPFFVWASRGVNLTNWKLKNCFYSFTHSFFSRRSRGTMITHHENKVPAISSPILSCEKPRVSPHWLCSFSAEFEWLKLFFLPISRDPMRVLLYFSRIEKQMFENSFSSFVITFPSIFAAATTAAAVGCTTDLAVSADDLLLLATSNELFRSINYAIH